MCFVLRLLRKGSFVVSLNFRRLLGAVFTPLATAVCMVGYVDILSRLSWNTRNFKNIKKINVDRPRAGNKRRIFFGNKRRIFFWETREGSYLYGQNLPKLVQ